MCGIAGGIGVTDEWVEGALDSIEHRGPDGRGLVQRYDAVHGHVRLSILDPRPRSGQPFTVGDCVLSFVGEIWNFRELREELEGSGYRFETTGDTEVLACMMHY